VQLNKKDPLDLNEPQRQLLFQKLHVSKTARGAFGAAGLSLVVAAGAHALVLCTMPDVKTYAGDNPPADCSVKSSYTPLPEPSAEEVKQSAADLKESTDLNAFDAQALSTRRELQRRVNDAAERLRRIEMEIVSLPPAGGGANSVQDVGVYLESSKARDEELADLRSQEHDAKASIAADRARFEMLTAQVAGRHGGLLPASWSRELSCSECPP
jgi:hypothetical protein